MNYDDYREQRREARRKYREARRAEHRERWSQFSVRMESRGQHGHIWGGLLILIIGVGALLKVSNTGLPYWLFSWQMLLIFLGFFIGLRHKFRGASWFVLMVIGGAFLANELNPDFALQRYIWPGILILVGIMIILKPRHKRCSPWVDGPDKIKTMGSGSPDPEPESVNYTNENFIDSTCVFSGTKKNIISKDFKGGDIVNIFGGAEINLSQADFTGRVPMEFTNIFGGTKLIIPANWSVQSEAVTIFGGLEDKRPVSSVPPSPDKVLVLSGTIIFGGIEIKSY